jgi:SAM-dependent methyltransferase
VQPVAEARRLILSLVPVSMIRAHDVLDAGCGAGDYSAAMADLGAQQVVGLDVSIHSLQHAKYLTAQGEFDQANLCDLPYHSESFDVIWSWGVLHYVPDSQAALREIVRVLRPGGVAVIHTLRAGLWSSLELGTAKVFSAAPSWVESLVLDAGVVVVPLVTWLLTGQLPQEQTSKPMRQKLRERLFVPGDLHTFGYDQLAAGLGPVVSVHETHPPVSDLLRRDMSMTVVAWKQ